MAGMPQDMRHSTIDGSPAAALLVVKPAGVTQAGENEAMLNAFEDRLVSIQPCNGADRRREKEKAISQSPFLTDLAHCQRRRHGDPRQIVVGETGMADM